MAYRNLGNCYLNGWGVVKDEEKAFEWFRKAFALGSKQAVSDLVKCYRNGIGTKESFFQSIILKKQYKDHYQFESKGDLFSSDYEEEVWELLQEKKKALHFILKKELETFLLKELSCIVCSYFE